MVNPYDWTFTPSGYNGSITPDPLRLEEEDETSDKLPNLCVTKDRIDYEKLKEKERILFYDDVVLYEDELDDNGCAKLSCKIVSVSYCVKARRQTCLLSYLCCIAVWALDMKYYSR